MDCKSQQETLPSYAVEDFLCPMAPFQNTRYDQEHTAQVITHQIQPGLLVAGPQYAPQEWVPHTNPEGARYFVNSLLHAVTDAAIDKVSIHAAVMRAVKAAQERAAHLAIPLPQNSELYFFPANVDAGPATKCSYYGVDHDSQTTFWMHAVDANELGIEQVTSESHLKHALQEQYWGHVEFFPHCPIPKKRMEELVSILRHAQLDMLTSSTSTFQYNAEQCEKFIVLFSNSVQNCVNDPYITCMAARIWMTIARNRFNTYYGEEYARLDRNKHILAKPIIKKSVVMNVVFALSFGIPNRVNEELELLMVDNMIYGIHWQKFMRDMKTAWKDVRFAAAVLTITNAVLLIEPMGPVSTYIGLASTVLSSGSLVSSLALLLRYSGAEEQVAAQAINEICRIEHPVLRYQPAAALYSIPKTFLIWSLVLFTTEIVGLVLEVCTSWAAVVLGILFAVIAAVLIVRFIVRKSTKAWRRFRLRSSSGSIV